MGSSTRKIGRSPERRFVTSEPGVKVSPDVVLRLQGQDQEGPVNPRLTGQAAIRPSLRSSIGSSDAVVAIWRRPYPAYPGIFIFFFKKTRIPSFYTAQYEIPGYARYGHRKNPAPTLLHGRGERLQSSSTRLRSCAVACLSTSLSRLSFCLTIHQRRSTAVFWIIGLLAKFFALGITSPSSTTNLRSSEGFPATISRVFPIPSYSYFRACFRNQAYSSGLS
jgi:hypothetical protein